MNILLHENEQDPDLCAVCVPIKRDVFISIEYLGKDTRNLSPQIKKSDSGESK